MKQNPKIEYQRALIYCRVSSDRQVKEGHGLDSQEQRCVQYVKSRGLEPAEIFRDEGISGKLFDRPAMQNLIAYLDAFPNEKFVVVFDDLARFSRDVPVHLQLKTELVLQRKAKLECLNFNFEDSPTGRYVELIMVGAGQLAREQNTEQVKNKMKARLELGYWPFCPPPGLKNEKGVLTAFEPYASIYKKAIEQFRDYELNTLQAVTDFIRTSYSEHGITKTLSLNGTQRILTNLLYSGYLEYKPWGVALKKGQHDGFITYDTYLAVQEKLANKSKPRLRKDYNIDFPVRGYALCHECNKPLTAGWFGGNGGKFPYYQCKTPGCVRRYKSISKKNLEGSLVELLQRVKPQAEALDYVAAVLNDVWQNRSKQEQVIKNGLSRDISDIENKNVALMTRISQSTNAAMIGEYEKAITQNLADIENIKTKLSKIKYPQRELQTALGVVLNFAGSPLKQWESKDYKLQRLLLGMYFEQKLIYHPESGFQTVKLPLILDLCQSKTTNKNHLVEMPGVKPGSKTNSLFNWSQD